MRSTRLHSTTRFDIVQWARHMCAHLFGGVRAQSILHQYDMQNCVCRKLLSRKDHFVERQNIAEFCRFVHCAMAAIGASGRFTKSSLFWTIIVEKQMKNKETIHLLQTNAAFLIRFLLQRDFQQLNATTKSQKILIVDHLQAFGIGHTCVDDFVCRQIH